MPAAPRARLSGGVHFLASPRIATQLVRSCPLRPNDLVVEFGAGQGAITTRLAETHARILAVERDPEFVRKLRNRFNGNSRVRVVQADIRTVPVPHRPFCVVASIPYALSTVVLRRLLNPQRTAMRHAAFIVEWGFAKRLTTAVPRDLEQAWWAARFDIRLLSRVPARCFSPPPRVDSAHILVKRRPVTHDRALWTLLTSAHHAPDQPAHKVVGSKQGLREAGIDPAAPAGRVRPADWAGLARHLSGDRSLHWPPLPPRFR